MSRFIKVSVFIIFCAGLALALLNSMNWHPKRTHPYPIIATIDTGFDAARLPAPSDRILPGIPFKGEKPLDVNGHGTRVIQLLLGQTHTSRILPIKVSDHGSLVTPDLLADAIDAAVQAKADVINCSFGVLGSSNKLVRALERADRAGAILISAAGQGIKNPYRPISVSRIFPQAHPSAFVVGTVEQSGEAILPQRLENYGELIDVSVLRPEGGRFIPEDPQSSGSSFATAIVSGAVAALMEKQIEGGEEFPKNRIQFLLRGITRQLPPEFETNPEVLSEPRGGFGYLALKDLEAVSQVAKNSAVECRLAHREGRTLIKINSDTTTASIEVKPLCQGGGDPQIYPGSAKGLLYLVLENQAPTCTYEVRVKTSGGETLLRASNSPPSCTR